MKNKLRYFTKSLALPISVLILIILSSFLFFKKEKPVFYVIGDSTVRNGDGSGRNGQWGWGSFMADYFDTSKISVRNLAYGGTSSRTFITSDRWNKIVTQLKKGDYVILQFGHNDGGALDDTARARGTIKGTGDESKEIYNPITKKQEVVHTYGWYIRKYISDTKKKKAIPIVCSLIPRNDWKDGKIIRASESYGKWAMEAAKAEGAYFIDLNDLVALRYEELGPDKVKPFFPADHTHTNLEGAKINTEIVINALREIKLLKLKKFLKNPHR